LDWPRLILALDDSEVFVEALLEADGHIKLTAGDHLVPPNLSTGIRRAVNRRHQALEVLPLAAGSSHREFSILNLSRQRGRHHARAYLLRKGGRGGRPSRRPGIHRYPQLVGSDLQKYHLLWGALV
jgi:hypothetical protein